MGTDQGTASCRDRRDAEDRERTGGGSFESERVVMSEELILSPHDVLWHERRRQVYTASDMGVLFGLPGFASRTLSDVWHEKRYGLEADKSTPSTRLGQRMEPIILDEAEEVLGKIIDRQKWMVSGSIGATLDGRREEDGRPVEAKTAGLL